MESQRKRPLVRVGLTVRNYAYGHVTYLNEPEGIEYVRGWDYPFHYQTDNQFLINTHLFFGPPGVNLFHVWNGIVVNCSPWIVSFESYFPRYGAMTAGRRLYKWALSRLKSDHCKAILPTCEVAKRFIESKPWYDDKISRKVRILYYAVRRVEPIPVEKPPGEVRILFIGHEFFRKGGHLLTEAFEKISPGYPNLRLTVISRLDHSDYVTHASPERAAEYRRRLENHPRITYMPSVPNLTLLKEIFPSADIYAFPTLDDTFGLVVIEALSAGIPVIATAVRAIPEMISDGVEGRLIRVPTDSRGIITEDLPQVEEHIVRELVRVLPEIIENPEKRGVMAKNAVAKWESKFSAAQRAKQLTELYSSIIKGEFGA